MSDFASEGAQARPFPDALCAELSALLQRSLRPHFKPGEVLTLTGELGHGHCTVSVHLAHPDSGESVVLDVAVETVPNHLDNPLHARDLALDHAQTLLRDFLVNHRIWHLHVSWQAEEVDGKTIWVRGERRNVRLESEADAFLAAHGFGPEGEVL